VSVTKADGAALRAQPGTVTVKLDAHTRQFAARNVIAQTKTGSAQDVVMAGAHLDSVPEGPGINDNGSGVAAVLETALQLGSTPLVRNAVRFGFWGAEEVGLVGSENYVESLNADQLKDIALYLNFDMLASPNPGYFTYDGDQSAPQDRDGSAPRVPEGSAGIERALVAYLRTAGKTAQDTSFDGRSDYDGFTQAGIPSGGLFAGAEENMTADQARLWGGTADQPSTPTTTSPATPSTTSTAPRWTSRAVASPTSWASTPRTSAGATASRYATTAPATCSHHPRRRRRCTNSAAGHGHSR